MGNIDNNNRRCDLWILFREKEMKMRGKGYKYEIRNRKNRIFRKESSRIKSKSYEL